MEEELPVPPSMPSAPCWLNLSPWHAMLSKGAHVLVVDVLAGEGLDLCNDSIFEQLLRLCFSGRVRFGAAGPPRHLYSRLRLKPGGLPNLRTPEHLNGVPGLSTRNQLLVDSSRDLLELLQFVACHL